jgi:putative transcriptional regulator
VDSGLRLRERRLALSMTQAQLASYAGVSRQLVAAAEGGRNTPAVDGALRLAAALNTSVEALFGASERLPLCAAIGGELRSGALLRLGRVGEQLVGAPLPRGGDLWGSPDGILVDGHLECFPGAQIADLVIGGCDPALGIAEAMLAPPHRMLALSASTDVAVAALTRGTLHAAIAHGPAKLDPRVPVPVTRWRLARWQVGVALAPQLGTSPSLEAVLHSETPLVTREAHAASQQALERARLDAGLAPIVAGPTASAHLEAARIAAERGWSAVTTESAAHAFALDFLPVESHDVEIWVATQWLAHPAVQALGELLHSSAFTRRVAHFGGYDLAGCGALAGAT